jgi:hypothetical protein
MNTDNLPAEDTQNDLAIRDHGRDPQQQAVDTRVAQMAKDWEAAGKPEPGKGEPTQRYGTTKDDQAGAKEMVRKAGRLAKVGIHWYKSTDPDEAGNLVIKFGVSTYVPPKKRNRSQASQETASDGQAPAEGNQATPPAEGNQDAPPAEGKRGGVFSKR